MSRSTSPIENNSRAAAPGAEPAVTLGALKDLLHRFTWERRDWDRERAAAEFGALVLYVIQQADRLDIDLVSAGETHMLKLAGSQPTLVQARNETKRD
jgi:hypothetical protein